MYGRRNQDNHLASAPRYIAPPANVSRDSSVRTCLLRQKQCRGRAMAVYQRILTAKQISRQGVAKSSLSRSRTRNYV